MSFICLDFGVIIHIWNGKKRTSLSEAVAFVETEYMAERDRGWQNALSQQRENTSQLRWSA
jgi:hypothetical protein